MLILRAGAVGPRPFRRGSRVCVDTDVTGRLYLIRGASQHPIALTPERLDVSFPTLSPDGRHVAFVVSPGGRRPADLHRVDIDGRNLRRLTSIGGWDTDLDWSPQGDRVAFSLGSRRRQTPFTISADGGDRRRVAGAPHESGSPDWSPDGKQIVFVKNWSRERAELHVLNVARGTHRPLARGASRPFDPAWSPNGAWIVYCEDGAERSTRLCVIHPDESGRRFLTPLTRTVPMAIRNGPQTASASSSGPIFGVGMPCGRLPPSMSLPPCEATQRHRAAGQWMAAVARVVGPQGSDCFDSPSGLAAGEAAR
jgi:Tol biopolymer transport system component